MNSGCICCTLVGDFAKSLKQVVETYAPDRIIIEPSGVGKLSEVVTAVEDVKSEAGIEINSKITVVDGKKAKMYMKNFGEFFVNQVEHASTIVISRTQLMKEDALAECLTLLGEHNDSATIITTPWDQLEGSAIRSAIDHDRDLAAEMMHEHEHHHHEHHHHDEECCCGHDHHDHHHHHEHDDHCECGCHDHHHHHADEVFTSWGIQTIHKFNRAELEDVLKMLSMSDEFGTVLRAKGIIESEDGQWMEFDMVPEETEIRNCEADYTGRICVIGTELNTEYLNKVFGK
jgi:G3E family GTPase